MSVCAHVLLLLVSAAPQPHGPYCRFAVISDAHVPARGAEGVRHVVQALLALQPRPSFVVDTGDCTELGWSAEVRAYEELVVRPLRAAGIELYAAPGNHDARWSETDLRLLSSVAGPAPRVVRRHGVALLVLNTSLPGEQHGQLEHAEMLQVARECMLLDRYVPRLAFAHHPLLPDDSYVSDGAEWLKVLSRLGVSVLFVGHGHGWQHWRVNGVHQLMTASAMEGAYRIVDVGPRSLLTWGLDRDGGEAEGSRVELHLAPDQTPSIEVTSAYVEEGKAKAAISAPSSPYPLEVEVRVAGADPVHALVGDDPVEVSLDISRMPAGIHRITARAATADGDTLIGGTDIVTSSEAASVQWLHRTDGSVFASPRITDSRAYVATRGGSVYALDLESGEAVWRFAADGPIQSSPAVHGGWVIVGCSTGAIYGLRADTGSLSWTTHTGGPVRSSPTVHANRVYVGSGDGRLWCLGLPDGRQVWTHAVGRLIESQPAVADGRVVFGAWDQRVHCLRAATGDELWSAPVGRSVYFSPATSACAIRDGRVFAAAPSNTIHAFDLETGRELWTAEGAAGYTSPAFTADGTVVYGTMDGNLIGLDPADGVDRYRVDLGAGTYNSSPVVSGDRIAVGGLRGWLYIADASSGEKTAEVELGGSYVFATPAFSGRWVVAGLMDGRAVGIRLAR